MLKSFKELCNAQTNCGTETHEWISYFQSIFKPTSWVTFINSGNKEFLELCYATQEHL